MAIPPTPRVRLPAEAKPGEIIEIKALISHEMETGQRKDSAGNVIPRKIIKEFVVHFNGKTVFRAEWYPSISANPYQAFYFRATESGTFDFIWHDDDGAEYKTSANLTVQRPDLTHANP
jgi:sulfur-oxidizing protein SoxZ